LGEQPGILDWYTILVGILALAALMLHGALWVALKTVGTVRDRFTAHRAAELVGSRGADRVGHLHQFPNSAGNRGSLSQHAMGRRVSDPSQGRSVWANTLTSNFCATKLPTIR